MVAPYRQPERSGLDKLAELSKGVRQWAPQRLTRDALAVEQAPALAASLVPLVHRARRVECRQRDACGPTTVSLVGSHGDLSRKQALRMTTLHQLDERAAESRRAFGAVLLGAEDAWKPLCDVLLHVTEPCRL